MKRIALSTLCLFALVFAACEVENEVETVPAEEVGPMDADIEAYRSEVMVRTQSIDETIAELDAKAQNAGEEMREEYNEMIDELREERREIADDLDNIEAETAEELEEARMEIDDEVDELRREAAEARIAMAENVDELQAATAAEMAEIDREMDRLGNEMGEESREALAELEQQREALGRELDQLGDATEEGFIDLRNNIVEAFRNLGDAIGDIRIPVDVDVETRPVN